MSGGPSQIHHSLICSRTASSTKGQMAEGNGFPLTVSSCPSPSPGGHQAWTTLSVGNRPRCERCREGDFQALTRERISVTTTTWDLGLRIAAGASNQPRMTPTHEADSRSHGGPLQVHPRVRSKTCWSCQDPCLHRTSNCGGSRRLHGARNSRRLFLFPAWRCAHRLLFFSCCRRCKFFLKSATRSSLSRRCSS